MAWTHNAELPVDLSRHLIEYVILEGAPLTCIQAHICTTGLCQLLTAPHFMHPHTRILQQMFDQVGADDLDYFGSLLRQTSGEADDSSAQLLQHTLARTSTHVPLQEFWPAGQGLTT
eukprot:1162119-Pelagomonas_calceolata.AAC.7